MKLDDIAVPAMTLRDLIAKAFKDDWNLRRKLLQEGLHGCSFTLGLTLNQVTVDPELARQVLKEVMNEEAL